MFTKLMLFRGKLGRRDFAGRQVPARAVLIALCLAIAAGSASAQLAPSSWPSRQGNAQGTGRTEALGPWLDAPIAWIAEQGEATESGVTIGPDGNVYVGTSGGVAKLDRTTGVRLWEHQFAGDYGHTYATFPVSADGTVYGAALQGGTAIEAVDTNGNLKWLYSFGPGRQRLLSSPIIGDDGTIYAALADGGIHAINPDGTRKWHIPMDKYFISSLALSPDGNTLYAAEHSWTFYAINANTGNIAWYQGHNSGLNAGYRSSPAVADDGTIYIGTDQNSLDAYNPDGSTKWIFWADGDTHDTVFSSPAIASDGTVVFLSTSSNLYGLNPDGSVRWQVNNTKLEHSSPIIDGLDHIYITGYDGLYCYAMNGSLLYFRAFEGTTGTTNPLALGADGTLFLRTTEGLHAIVPEPASLSLLAAGALALVRRRRNRRRG